MVSEAKNVARRLSTGRASTGGGGAFGFQPRVGSMDSVALCKGGPHTPSKKLTEAKHR